MSNGSDAFDALSRMLEQQRLSQEADKDRGVQMLNMKIQQTEAEKQRAHGTMLTLYETLLNIRSSYDKAVSDFTKMGGVLKEAQGLENSTGKAASIIEESMMKSTDDLTGMREILNNITGEIGGYKNKMSEINKLQSEYSNIMSNVAPELFDLFSGQDKGDWSSSAEMSAPETMAAIEFAKKKYGIDLDQNQLSALRNAFLSLESNRFKELSDRERLRIEAERNRIQETGNMLEFATRIGKTTGKGVDPNKEFEELRSETVNRYNQLGQRMRMINESIGADDIPVTPVTLLESTKDFTEAKNTILHSFAQFIDSKQRWWEFMDELPDEQQNKLNKYMVNMKAGLIDEAEGSVRSLLEDFYINPGFFDSIDYDKDPYAADYMSSMIKMYKNLEAYEMTKKRHDDAMQESIGSGVDVINRGIESIRIKEQYKRKGLEIGRTGKE